MKKTFLFTDWCHVHKGQLEATFDPDRLSEWGKEAIERNKRAWGIYPDLSGHGMKRTRLPHGVKIGIEKAKKSAPWLVADQPWESTINWLTILHEDGRFRCWYESFLPKEDAGTVHQVFDTEREMKVGGSVLCYAESEDGVHWEKPSLNICSFRGATDNNIVSPYGNSTAVFRDDSAPAAERYKCFHWSELADASENGTAGSKYGLYGAVSPDGYRWTLLPDPLFRYFHDTQNVGCWDPDSKKYIAYLRGHFGGRAISRSETDDFRHWPAAEILLCPGAQDEPSADYYTNGFTWYPGDPSLKFFFCAVYHHHSDLVDVRLAVSHDGKAFNWVSQDPIIEIGNPGAWDSGSIYACPNLVHLPDGGLALPYHGNEMTHNEFYPAFYEEYPEGRSGYAWATWEDGRLAGIEASDHGEFFTKPAPFEADHIEINARTTKVGRIDVAVWEAISGFCSRPLDGYTFEDHIPFTGDTTWTSCRWKGKRDLSELKDKNIQLHIRMSSAKIFGYRYA